MTNREYMNNLSEKACFWLAKHFLFSIFLIISLNVFLVICLLKIDEVCVSLSIPVIIISLFLIVYIIETWLDLERDETKGVKNMTYENNIFYCTKNNIKWISVDGKNWYVEEKRIAELEGQVTRAFEVLEGKRKRIEELESQIDKMKVCSNCKHFNKVDDLEYCHNCERQLVNSLDKLPREEIIKDEWELSE